MNTNYNLIKLKKATYFINNNSTKKIFKEEFLV
jgi:hypothetical protein